MKQTVLIIAIPAGRGYSSRQAEQTSFLEPLNPASTVKKVIGVSKRKGRRRKITGNYHDGGPHERKKL